MTGPDHSAASDPPAVPDPSLRYYRDHFRPDPAALPRAVRTTEGGEVYAWTRLIPRQRPVDRPTRRTEPQIPLPPDPVSEFRPPLVADLDGHGTLKPDPFAADTPAEFVAAMRRFRAWAGDPSVRDLEKYSGGLVPRSTFQDALHAGTLPKQTVLAAFISACGGGVEEVSRWVTAWRALRLRGMDGGSPA